MRLSKLTAFLLSIPLLFLISCESTDEVEKENIYIGRGLPMTGAQETPPVTTNANGSIDADYNRLTKILTYRLVFYNLTRIATMAHIHGPGEAGIAAPIVQNFNNFPGGTTGSYSGTLLIDGIKLLESELLAGRYYINIHTSTNPNGEIRGQLILSKQ